MVLSYILCSSYMPTQAMPKVWVLQGGNNLHLTTRSTASDQSKVEGGAPRDEGGINA